MVPNGNEAMVTRQAVQVWCTTPSDGLDSGRPRLPLPRRRVGRPTEELAPTDYARRSVGLPDNTCGSVTPVACRAAM